MDGRCLIIVHEGVRSLRWMVGVELLCMRV